MHFTIAKMSEMHARTALRWRYRPPYARYNHDPKDGDRDLQEWLDPESRYYSILDEYQNLVGYCCFGVEAQVPGGNYDNAEALDIGMGIRPNLRVADIAPMLLHAIFEWAKVEFSPEQYRVTIATFNRRVVRLCAEAGFQPKGTFVSKNGQEFVQMSRKV